MNLVPERHYVKFLELLGLQLYPPTAARGTVTFWLAAAQPATVLVRAETEVATPRTEVDEPVVFSTVADLPIVPCEFSNFAAVTADDVKRWRFFDDDTKCIIQVRGGPSNVDNDLISKCAKAAHDLIGPEQIKVGAPPPEAPAAGSGSAATK